MTEPTLPTTPIFEVTFDQLEAFAELCYHYFREQMSGRPAPVPLENMAVSAASMLTSVWLDNSFNRPQRKKAPGGIIEADGAGP